MFDRVSILFFFVGFLIYYNIWFTGVLLRRWRAGPAVHQRAAGDGAQQEHVRPGAAQHLLGGGARRPAEEVIAPIHFYNNIIRST